MLVEVGGEGAGSSEVGGGFPGRGTAAGRVLGVEWGKGGYHGILGMGWAYKTQTVGLAMVVGLVA